MGIRHEPLGAWCRRDAAPLPAKTAIDEERDFSSRPPSCKSSSESKNGGGKSQREDQEDDIFQEDPRRELANNLLEYRLFKMAAETLEEREQEATLFFTRPSEPQLAEGEKEQDLIEVSLFDLLAAFKDIVEKEPGVITHEVLLEEITVKERFDYILDVLTHKKRLPFVELIRSDPRKMAMVVTFLALLELIRAQLVSVKQQRAFGQLWVYKKAHAKVDRHPFRGTL